MATGSGISIDIKGGLAAGSSAVQLDPAGVARLLSGPDGDVYRWMFKVGDAIAQRARAEVGVDTGNLRDHIVKRMVQEGRTVGVQVIADVPYAVYHHEGSRAVNGKLMVFTPKGSDVAVFTMKRKAIDPNRFFVRSLDAVRSMIGL